ncbi:hypothetical protein R6Z07M_001998 [Ovis aries]
MRSLPCVLRPVMTGLYFSLCFSGVWRKSQRQQRTLLLWVVEPRSPSEDLQSRAHVTPPQAPSVVCGTSSNGVEGPWAEALRSRQELGFV